MVIDYGKIIFGGVDSSDYGIYISGEGVYNAPERVVEFVEVPGRNGTIAMDQGRYENISVTYPAMYLGKNQEEFREKLSDFRNAILSQKGYQKLEDSYHPDEYRMGVYASGLEVTKLFRKMRGGEFELTLNCKPQRWLTVGELPIPVDSGDVLQNPTLFDAGPLLEIEGYGDVSFNGYNIDIVNALMGDVEILPAHNSGSIRSGSDSGSSLINDTIDSEKMAMYKTGDTITVDPSLFRFVFVATDGYGTPTGSGDGDVSPTVELKSESAGASIQIDITFPEVTFTAGTSQELTYTGTYTTHERDGDGVATITMTCKLQYTPSAITMILAYAMSLTKPAQLNWINRRLVRGKVHVDSTLSVLGHPTYIDCEMGEAYQIVNDTPVSLNSKVALGSDLPVLAPGSNKITFDNTITDLKIAPRWWRI